MWPLYLSRPSYPPTHLSLELARLVGNEVRQPAVPLYRSRGSEGALWPYGISPITVRGGDDDPTASATTLPLSLLKGSPRAPMDLQPLVGGSPRAPMDLQPLAGGCPRCPAVPQSLVGGAPHPTRHETATSLPPPLPP